MAVMIKDMEMPSGCRWCRFNYDSMCCLIDPGTYDLSNGLERRPDCPLVEVHIPKDADLELLKEANFEL